MANYQYIWDTIKKPRPTQKRRTAATPRKNPNAVALSKLGASKGGQTSASKMTPYERSERARNAALKRWNKRKKR